MKTLLILLPALTLSISAFAETRTTAFSELQKTAALEQDAFQNNECSVKFKALSGGYSILLEDDTQSAELLVRANDEIQYGEEVEKDGSFVRTFEVKGAGYLRVLHADDSYESIELTNGGRTMKCELEF